MFTKIDHSLKFSRLELIQILICDYNRIKLEDSNKWISGKSTNI